MKIKHERVLKDGRVQVLIELGPAEPFPQAAINPEHFYRLNAPMDDVVGGYLIEKPQRVCWDSLTQEWIDV